ncbi:secreted RxLR effector protein 78-like [Gigantopelta aegis]|uniref:secreted RxLR effector protein 78-like n=1 Tax=Gigantopelta aegis TaxID=1735272 RepID=UPI001B8874F2|nr:secreted RxLR effector protein 78-like [Gigantopelta aegis]
MRQEQVGFRKGMSCRDHIFTLTQILEQSKEWNSTVYVNFIDFEKAFDSIHRESLWRIVRHYGIPSKLVNIIRLSYTDFCSQVINGNLLSDPFSINTGVKQGCILSPFLFIIGID